MTKEHPVTYEDLINLALGCASPDEEQWLRAHLREGCERCQEDLAWLERVLGVTRDEVPPEPPSWVIHRARQLYNRWEIESIPLRDRLLALLMTPRTVIGVIFVAAAAFLFASGAFVWRGIPTAQSALLSRVVGDVEVWPPPEGPWKPAHQGFRPGAGTRLRTAPGATVELDFPDRSRLVLRGRGMLGIQALYTLTGIGPLVARLDHGRGRAAYQVMAGPPGGSFVVSTPVAAIRGRGARYDVEVQGDGTTTIWVLEGSVVVSAGEQKVTVHAGEQLVISPTAPAVPLQPSPFPATWTPTPTASPVRAVPPVVGRSTDTPTPVPTTSPSRVPGRPGGPLPASPTPTSTPRPPTPTRTVTPTPSITPTWTPSLTSTPTPSPTVPPPTPRPPTPTPVPPTHTPVPPSPTPAPPTLTPSPPPPTDTPLPPTETPVPSTPTPTPKPVTTPPKPPTLVPPSPTPGSHQA